MDFIERWFGVSPDNGDGTLELLYIAVAVVVVAAFVGRKWLVRRWARRAARKA